MTNSTDGHDETMAINSWFACKGCRPSRRYPRASFWGLRAAVPYRRQLVAEHMIRVAREEPPEEREACERNSEDRRQARCLGLTGDEIRRLIARTLLDGPLHYLEVIARSGVSKSSVCRHMAESRWFARVNPGVYRLTAAGRKALKG